MIDCIELNVLTAFDGTNPTLSVGNGSDPEAYCEAQGLSSVSQIPLDGAIVLVAATGIKVFFTSGGSTAGSVRVSVKLRRA